MIHPFKNRFHGSDTQPNSSVSTASRSTEPDRIHIENHDCSILGLRPGQSACIVRLDGGCDFVHRAMDMGLVPGRTVTRLNSGGGHGPVLIACGESRIALGMGMAEKVHVRSR